MAGRKPKPTSQKIAEGNPGRRALPGEPAFDSFDATPPMKLSAGARKVWDSLSAQLDKAGILKCTDAYVLAAACDCWDKYQKASAQNDRLNGLEYLKQFRQLAASLGLSPTDRARLGLKGEAKKDELEEYEQEGQNIHGKVIDGRRQFGT